LTTTIRDLIEKKPDVEFKISISILPKFFVIKVSRQTILTIKPSK